MALHNILKLSNDEIKELEKLLFELISEIPQRRRVAFKKQIDTLSERLGFTMDLLIDRRHLTWKKDGKARQTVGKRSVLAGEVKKYSYEARSTGELQYLTLIEMAKLVKLSRKTLYQRISKGKGKYSITVNDEVITISRS